MSEELFLEWATRDYPDNPIARAVAAIEYDLCDRRGLKWEWDKIDDDVKETIRADWRSLVSKAIAGSSST